VIWKLRKPDGDELSVGGLVVGLLFLVPGALVLSIPPLLAAFMRIGNLGTALLVLGIVVFAIAYFPAYEHLKTSSPPTPRRDLVVILFSALLAGLWIYLFTNVVVAILVLGGFAAILLLPEDLVQRFGDHLPMQGMGARAKPRSATRRRSAARTPIDEAAVLAGAGRRRRARVIAIVAGILAVLLLTVLHFGPHCLNWARQGEWPDLGFACDDMVGSGELYPSFELYYLLVGIAVAVVTYYVAVALATRSARATAVNGSAEKN
jgi:hypothetical protein